MVDITLKSNLNRTLTHSEVDGNFTNLKDAVEDCINIANGVEWVAGTYKYGALVKYQNIAYVCKVASTSSIPTVITDWTAIGNVGYALETLSNANIASLSDGDTLVYNSTASKWQNKKITQSFRLRYVGKLKTGVGTTRYYPPINMSITGYYLTIDDVLASTGTFVINKNGSPLYTGTIPANVYKTDISALSIPLTLSDYLTVDLTVGSGQNLTIVFIYQ